MENANTEKIRTGRDALIALAIMHGGDWRAMYEAVKSRSTIPEEAYAKADGVKAVTILDPEYPQTLKNTHQPPFVLFGDVPAGFMADAHVQNVDERLFSDDEKAAHSTVVEALRKSGASWIESGSDMTIVWHDGDKSGSFTPFPAGHVRSIADSPYRKSIMAGVSRILFVFRYRHDAVGIDISFHLNANGDVYALPHPFQDADDKCNELIENGAGILTRSMLNSYQPSPRG